MADTKSTRKVKVPPKPQAEQKKKKKNDPLTPQPKWLFPPEEENPVLNPKQRTDEELKQEKDERGKALDYMQRRVHNVPDRPAPPPQLLTMIGVFLTEFGFNSTSRIFTNERKGRQQLTGWEDAVGQKLERGIPKLEKIYRDWYRDWKIAQKEQTSSSEGGSEAGSDSGSDTGVDVLCATKDSSEDDSEASSDGFGGSDVEMKEALKNKKGKKAKKQVSSSSETSTSDSDADDEKEPSKIKSAIASKKMATKIAKPSGNAMINHLKRKALTSLSASPETGSNPESDQVIEMHKGKKPRVENSITTTTGNARHETVQLVTKAAKETSSSGEYSSSSSSEAEQTGAEIPKKAAPCMTEARPVIKKAATGPSSSSNSDTDASLEAGASSKEPRAKSTTTKLPKASPSTLQAASSDSSATINGDSKKPSASTTPASKSSPATSSSSDSDTSSAPEPSAPLPSKKTGPSAAKKKHQGAKPTGLAELSAASPDNSYLSNKYQSYGYADKAYKDLSATRGKGFTKEKNKKKRGSYRGGAIDTSGGKSFKFDD